MLKANLSHSRFTAVEGVPTWSKEAKEQVYPERGNQVQRSEGVKVLQENS